MTYLAHDSRAKNVPLSISLGSQRKDFLVDQTVSLPNGKHFRPITTLDFEAGTDSIIQITNHNTVGFVIVDALQLLPIEQVAQ